MLIGKQVDRLVAKVMRLTEVYQPFLITESLAPQVMLTENGSTRPVQKGDRWGGEFQVSRFSFKADGIENGKKYGQVSGKFVGKEDNMCYVKLKEAFLGCEYPTSRISNKWK